MDKKKILIADDEPDILRLIKFILEKRGFEVFAASDGERAFRIALDICPDLIVLDVLMPNLNGVEVCQKLKKNEKTRNIPVVMLSAKSQGSEIKYGLEAGAADYIPKPFNTEDFVKRITSLIDGIIHEPTRLGV
ncbi:MAG: response regulator [Candidatus Subteraquimicrobiales bacterium]|nr:response regulator [Candidatus Subteraquimicrobiales bacterium]